MKVGIRERLIRAAVLAVALPATVQAADEAKPVQRYTFSWPLSSDPASAPRGGTTQGPEVELDREPSSAWKAFARGRPAALRA